MLTSSIGWILIGSGVITAGGGFAALFLPKLFLRVALGDGSPTDSAVFFVRHWGVLIVAIGVLIVYSAYVPAIRVPVLVAAAVEKFAIGLLVVLGPQKRAAGDKSGRADGRIFRCPVRGVSGGANALTLCFAEGSSCWGVGDDVGATANAREEADPCGMTARKTTATTPARARATAKANTGVSPLRIMMKP